MTEANVTFRQYRPRVGDPVTYEGRVVGTVSSTEGNLCWCAYETGTAPFIWCFKDGLNAMHEWPTKQDGPLSFCPGITPAREVR